MAEAIAAAVTATANAVAANFTAAGLAKAAVSLAINLAISGAQQSYARQKQRRQLAEQLANQSQLVRSAVSPRRLAYGRCVLSGTLALAESTGNANNLLHLVIPLCDGPIDAFEEVWFNDEPVYPLNGTGFATGGRWIRNDRELATQSATVNGSGNWTMTLANTPTQVFGAASAAGDGITSSASFSQAGSVVSGSGRQPDDIITVQYSYAVTALQAVRLKQYLGTAGQTADADLVSEVPAKWTSNHRLRGIAYLYCRLQRDEAVFPEGMPNIKAQIRGVKVYDPRKDTTNGGAGAHRTNDPSTWEWSQNPALCILHYLTSSLGYGASFSKIDLATFAAAANVCDELVQGSGSSISPRGSVEPRFTLNGAIDLDESSDPKQVLEQMLTTCQGELYPSEGKWRLVVAAYASPVASLDERDFAGYAQVITRTPRSDLFNAVKASYFGADKGNVATEAPAYRSASYAAEDGVEIMRSVQLPFTRTASEAQRLSRLMVERARRAATLTADFNLRTAMRLYVGNRVALTMARFGFAATVFRVASWSFQPSGLIKMTLRQDDADAYSWSHINAAEVPAPPLSSLPNPFVRPSIGGLTLSSGTSLARRRSDGVVEQLVRVSWTASTDPVVLNGGRVEIDFRRATDSTWTDVAAVAGNATDTLIGPVQVGSSYIVRARFVNSIGVPGPWVFANGEVTGSSSIVADAILASGKGVNLLENATLNQGPQEWFVQWANGASASITNGQQATLGFENFVCQDGAGTRTQMNPNIRPKPYGALAHYETSGGTYGFGTQRLIYTRAKPCLPNERIELQARAASLNADARLVALFYTASGAFISSSAPTGGASDVASGEVTGLDQIANFKHLWGFVNAPSGAAQMAWAITPKRNVSSGTSTIWFGMPYIGRAHAGQTQPSPWTGGQSVGTDSMEVEAATQTFTFAFGFGVPARQDTIFLQAGWKVEITATGKLNGVTNGTGYGTGAARSGIGNLQLWLYDTSLSATLYGAFICEPRSAPANVALNGSGTISETYTVPLSGNYRFDSHLFGDTAWASVAGSGTLQITIIKR